MPMEYLGDAVYVDTDPIGLVLTTNNGGPVPSNTIYLETEVMEALIRYYEKHKE